MRFDPKIEVICDDCDEQEWWTPEYGYTDFSGRCGHYDTSDKAFSAWCRSEGWSEDGEKTFCPHCTEDRKKGDDA